MDHGFSRMSTPPPAYGAPPPGYGPPPGYVVPPPKNNTVKVVLIVLAAVFGVGIFGVAILSAMLFPVLQKVRGNARLASCESNVKQIELALIVYAQDHNNKFPTGDYKAAVMPYTKTGALFRCPADGPGGESYSLNRNLQGVSLDKLSDPSNTVALYEGTNQTLDFRHEHSGGNVAVVGFADGRTRQFNQSQAQNLRWKP